MLFDEKDRKKGPFWSICNRYHYCRTVSWFFTEFGRGLLMTNEVLGRDLALEDSLHGKDLRVVDGDIALVEGTDNLVQALELRLSIHRGVLRTLGHPGYGSRLAEAIGLVSTVGNLRRVENLVREAILQEPRVRSIENLNVSSSVAVPGKVEVEVSVFAIAEPKPLNLVIALQSDR